MKKQIQLILVILIACSQSVYAQTLKEKMKVSSTASETLCDMIISHNQREIDMYSTQYDSKELSTEDMECIKDLFKSEIIRKSFEIEYWKKLIEKFNLKAELDPIAKTLGLNRQPIHYASYNNRLDIVKYLIEQVGVDVNVRDNHANTALHAATYIGNLEIAIYLVSKGADVNVKNYSDMTPIHYSVLKCDLSIAQFLVDHEANLNATCFYDRTPLFLTIFEDYLEDIKYNNHYVPFNRAIPECGLEMAQFLLNNGAHINKRDQFGKATLHYAAQGENLEMVKYFIEKGADLNLQDNHGRTPLNYSFNKDVREYLLSKGAK